MSDANGSGRLDRIEANLERVTERLDRVGERLDRLEAAQERDHEELRYLGQELRRLAIEADERMTRIELSIQNTAGMVDKLIELRHQDWQEIRAQREQDRKEREHDWNEIRKEIAAREQRLDERIGTLVSAIGKLVERLPIPQYGSH